MTVELDTGWNLRSVMVGRPLHSVRSLCESSVSD